MTEDTQHAQPGRSPCKGVTKKGQPCPYQGLDGSDYCHRHDPGRAAERSDWTRAGGRASGNDARALKAVARITRLDPNRAPEPGDLPGVRALVHQAIGDVIKGDIDPAVAGAVASLAKTYQILDAAVKDEELARELAELRALAEERGAA